MCRNEDYPQPLIIQDEDGNEEVNPIYEEE